MEGLGDEGGGGGGFTFTLPLNPLPPSLLPCRQIMCGVPLTIQVKPITSDTVTGIPAIVLFRHFANPPLCTLHCRTLILATRNQHGSAKEPTKVQYPLL